MASSAAGRSFARRNTSAIPKMDWWRSVVKLFTLQPSSARYGVWGSRIIRFYLKLTAGVIVYSTPQWVINKYAMPDYMVMYFSNGDERWKVCPSVWMCNKKTRMIPWRHQFILKNDPWTDYAPAYNQQPWGEMTRDDEPDERRGWAAYGTSYPGALFRGSQSTWYGAQTLYTLFYDQEITDEQSLPKFIAQSFALGLRNWYKDVRWTYWDSHDVTVDERLESLGWKRWTKRYKKMSGGIGGHKGLAPAYGGITFPGVGGFS